MNTAKLNLASAIAVVAIAVIGLYGWAAHLDILTRFVPTGERMKANTGICLALIGFRLLVLTGWLVERRGPLTLASRLAAGLASMIALLTLLEYALGIDLGIDQLVAKDFGDDTLPGRIPLPATLVFAVMGAALCLPHDRRGPRLTTIIAWALFAVAGWGILDYALTSSAHTQMAFPTAIALLLTGVTILTLPAPETTDMNP